MTLIPHKSETLVLPITAAQVVSRLSLVTQPARLTAAKAGKIKVQFNGYIQPRSFKISRKVNYPQNYLPLIKGKIEGSSRGCILFLKYQLFFSSLTFFTFWSTMTILIGLFFIFVHSEYLYAIVSFGAGAVNYTVTILNFNKQVKLSHEALEKVLNIVP